MCTAKILALNVPGWKNSGPQHWQTVWEARIAWLKRVDMPEWELPDKQSWVAKLEQEILAAPQDVYLVAHSLGCLAVADISEIAAQRVLGAFLVAPPELSRSGLPPILQSFKPEAFKPLLFRSVIVASSTDPYCSIEFSQAIATIWGSKIVTVGDRGHIGSDLDGWSEGLKLFSNFVAEGSVGEF